MKIIAVNKTAGFEYFIEDKYEAGIVLEGNEIKSVRAGAREHERQLLPDQRQQGGGKKHARRPVR